MKKQAWCDHMYLNDSRTEWAYSKFECLGCGTLNFNQAQENWKFCPVCGANRPPDLPD